MARKVMGRRKIALSELQEALLREVFAMTRGSRAELADTAAERAPAADSSAAALARAEAEAILAFEPVRRS